MSMLQMRESEGIVGCRGVLHLTGRMEEKGKVFERVERLHNSCRLLLFCVCSSSSLLCHWLLEISASQSE